MFPLLVAVLQLTWQQRDGQKRQTRSLSSAGSRPPLPKFSGYVEVEAHYIFHPSTIGSNPFLRSYGRKTPKKADFAMKQTNYVALAAT